MRRRHVCRMLQILFACGCTVALVWLPSCVSPRVSIAIGYEPQVPLINELVWFEGAAEDDGSILEWNWEFGDGAVASGRSVWHQYRSVNQSGGVIDRWKVVVSAVDDRGRVSSSSTYVQVQPATGELAGYCVQSVGTQCDGIGTRQPNIPAGSIIEYETETVTGGWWPVPSDRPSYVLVKLHFVPRATREVACTWTLYSLGSSGEGKPALDETIAAATLENFGPNDANWYNGYLGFPVQIDPQNGLVSPGWYIIFAEITASDPVTSDRNVYDFKLRVGNPTP